MKADNFLIVVDFKILKLDYTKWKLGTLLLWLIVEKYLKWITPNES